MLREWEKKHPGRVISIFSALTRVTASHLMDRTLYDFANLAATGRPEPDGDLAFDPDGESGVDPQSLPDTTQGTIVRFTPGRG